MKTYECVKNLIAQDRKHVSPALSSSTASYRKYLPERMPRGSYPYPSRGYGTHQSNLGELSAIPDRCRPTQEEDAGLPKELKDARPSSAEPAGSITAAAWDDDHVPSQRRRRCLRGSAEFAFAAAP